MPDCEYHHHRCARIFPSEVCVGREDATMRNTPPPRLRLTKSWALIMQGIPVFVCQWQDWWADPTAAVLESHATYFCSRCWGLSPLSMLACTLDPRQSATAVTFSTETDALLTKLGAFWMEPDVTTQTVHQPLTMTSLPTYCHKVMHYKRRGWGQRY